MSVQRLVIKTPNRTLKVQHERNLAPHLLRSTPAPQEREAVEQLIWERMGNHMGLDPIFLDDPRQPLPIVNNRAVLRVRTLQGNQIVHRSMEISVYWEEGY